MKAKTEADVKAHFDATLAFVRTELPQLTDEVIDAMAEDRHNLIVQGTGVDLPFDDLHKAFERVNLVYSLAAFVKSVGKESEGTTTHEDGTIETVSLQEVKP